jgi:hypothetical protein
MRIVNFGQMIDVQSRRMAHQIVVETADGRQHIVPTDEGTVTQLIAIMTNAPQQEARPAPAADPGLVAGLQRQVEMRRSDPEYAAALQDSEDGFWEQMREGAAPNEEPEFDEGAEIFGGEEDPGEASEPVMGVIAEDRIADAPEPVGGLGQPPPRAQLQTTTPPRPRVLTDKDGFAMPVRAKTVPKDEMGYPIVQKRAQAPRIPDDNGEEDGAQI